MVERRGESPGFRLLLGRNIWSDGQGVRKRGKHGRENYDKGLGKTNDDILFSTKQGGGEGRAMVSLQGGWDYSVFQVGGSAERRKGKKTKKESKTKKKGYIGFIGGGKRNKGGEGES